MRQTRAAACSLLAVSVLIWGCAADFAAGADEDSLATIVVMGQKQDMELQRVPEAITAFSAAALDQSAVIDPIDLNGQVPSLVITTSEGFSTNVAIRGIGFNVPQDDSAQPSVSYHEDGIYIANPIALAADFLDVDHVEVMRGPQGTVFGQNSIGGTINLITRQPTLDGINGFGDVSFGSFDLAHARGAINLPLADDIAVRIAADQSYQHGYAYATQVPGSDGHYDLGNQNNAHARMQALYQPSQAFSILLRAEYAQANQHEAEGKNINDPNANPWEESSDWPGTFIYQQKLAGATVSYTLPWAAFKSIASWQEVEQGLSVNEDGLDLALTSPAHDVEWFMHDSQSVTQELDLSSLPGGKVDWIVGAFYLHNLYKVAYDQYSASIADDYTPDELYSSDENRVLTQLEDGTLSFQSSADETRQSYSGFGQAVYHASNALRLTAGLRYTHDANATDFTDYYGDPRFGGGVIDVAQTARKFTYRAAVDYDLTPANLIYGSVATGFKPGGGNISVFAAVVPFQYEPETILAYEIGSKNSFFERRMSANVSGFYYQDHDMQFPAEDLIPFQGGVDNIPTVDVYGAEGEIAALLPLGFRLDVNLTLERGRVATHFLALDNISGNNADNAFIALYGITGFYSTYLTNPILKSLRAMAYRDIYGLPPPNLPQVTAGASLSQTFNRPDGSGLLIRVQARYRDHYADNVFGNSASYTTPYYVLADLYLDYTLSNRAWDISLAVNNLSNAAAVVSRYTNQFGGETTQQFYPPREFIGRVGFRF